MTCDELVKELTHIMQAHPEAREAEVWAYDLEGNSNHIKYIGYDRHRKPFRVKLEE